MNISDGKHIDLEDIDTIIHEEESKHNPNNDQIDTGDGDDDDDTILDNSGNIKVEDTLFLLSLLSFIFFLIGCSLLLFDCIEKNVVKPKHQIVNIQIIIPIPMERIFIIF